MAEGDVALSEPDVVVVGVKGPSSDVDPSLARLVNTGGSSDKDDLRLLLCIACTSGCPIDGDKMPWMCLGVGEPKLAQRPAGEDPILGRTPTGGLKSA